jgi:metal-dependent hydrolase (beta-lactamase superfamily II)
MVTAFLLDTGAHPDTVLQNAHDLNIDLSDVREVITHNHWDHVSGVDDSPQRDDEEESVGTLRCARRTRHFLQQTRARR